MLYSSIEIMKNNIGSVLQENSVSIYLLGSVALDDFKPGWSDIDILCFTACPIPEEQARSLAVLRHTLLEQDSANPYFRRFEGGFVSLAEFLTGQYTRIVYWGTSGQKITDKYSLDAFFRYELMNNGILLHGPDIREKLGSPSCEDFAMGSCSIIIQSGNMQSKRIKVCIRAAGCWILPVEFIRYGQEK